MRYFTILFLFLLSSAAFAQELGDKNKPVKLSGIKTPEPETGIKTPVLSPPKTPNSFEFPKPITEKPEDEKPLNLSGQQGFVNPNEKYLTKLNKPRGGVENDPAIKKNQNFGEIRTKAANVYIVFRDFGAIDGDDIRMSVNMATVVPQTTLTVDFQTYNLRLVEGFNKIDFLALNQGLVGPNTAQFMIFEYDENGKLLVENSWNLATGFTATFLVIKEK